MTTTVALIIFGRPDTTKRVLQMIRQYRPARLMVIADGPRADRPAEAERCRQARAVVDQGVDWPCVISRLYSAENMGCKARISTGLDWVFSTVDRAIVLEDDCLPDISFFTFCDELLERYHDDDRVMSICGTNNGVKDERTPWSYRFSRTPHCWGWASWSRAWKRFDITMATWPEVKRMRLLDDIISDRYIRWSYYRIFDKVYSGEIDCWDFQWTYASWMNSGLCVIPAVNLISNIGFGNFSTNTTQDNGLAEIPTGTMTDPLVHPTFFSCDEQFFLRSESACLPSVWQRIKRRLKKIFQ